MAEKKFIQKYNEIDHEVVLYLSNSSNLQPTEDQRFDINPASVLNLTIQDTFNDWNKTGEMTFMYLPEDIDPGGGAGQS